MCVPLTVSPKLSELMHMNYSIKRGGNKRDRQREKARELQRQTSCECNHGVSRWLANV